MESELKISVKLKGKSIGWMKWYCEQVDMTPAQVLRSAFAEKVSQFLSVPTGTPQGHQGNVQETPTGTPQGHQPRACTSIEDNLLSKYNKCHSAKKDMHQFGKGFIAKIDNKKFPERVFKAISENWESIQQSELSGVDMAELYNGYCENVPEGQTPCHPNSWILGGGWNNSEAEKKKDHYDF